MDEYLDHLFCSERSSYCDQPSSIGVDDVDKNNSATSTAYYDCISSLSPAILQDKMLGFDVQPDYIANDIRSVGVPRNPQLDYLSVSQSVPSTGKQELGNYSFAAGHPMTTAGLQSLVLQTTSATPSAGYNGTGKPRVRARRGQATDPHSIAERHRREKIAERMKNLQELVPNSNKSDKASMLHEIIEYVKFLQLQVKVLSMSRLGAAGAVVPLITDSKPEGANGLSLLLSLAGEADISPSPDQIALERQVVELMESNVSMAMQYLQSKGLCLMPIALATAISNGDSPSSVSISEERNKFV